MGKREDIVLDADDRHYEWYQRNFGSRRRYTPEEIEALRAQINDGTKALKRAECEADRYVETKRAWDSGYEAGRRQERQIMAEHVQSLETKRQQAEMRCRSIERAWEGEMQARRAAQTGALKWVDWVSSEMPRSGQLVLIECRQQYNLKSPPYPPPWIICCGYYDAGTSNWRSGSNATLAIQVRRWAYIPSPPDLWAKVGDDEHDRTKDDECARCNGRGCRCCDPEEA